MRQSIVSFFFNFFQVESANCSAKVEVMSPPMITIYKETYEEALQKLP